MKKLYDNFIYYKTANIYLVTKGYNCPINMKYYIDVNDGLCEKVKEECESLNPKITYCGALKYI